MYEYKSNKLIKN